jgi:hypothetical protein
VRLAGSADTVAAPGPIAGAQTWAQATGLDRVMAWSAGSPLVTIGLLDGPVAADHAGFATGALVATPRHLADTPASRHGTAVAGVLAARRDSGAPGVCPGCRVIVRPVFKGPVPAGAKPAEVAAAIVACVTAGTRLINISAAFTSSASDARPLHQALDVAAGRGVLVVAAAGNAGRVVGSPLVSHPWVIPVTSCGMTGYPLPAGNLGASIGRRGIRAPGLPVPSLAPGGRLTALGGTSLSAALVTGALALAWSLVPDATAGLIRRALTGVRSSRRGLVPPLLDAIALVGALMPKPVEAAHGYG